MDVSLSGRRVTIIALLGMLAASCGNRYDLGNESGRDARLDDARYHLSRGECTLANDAVDTLYNVPAYRTEEVRIIKASALACYARFNLLKVATSITGASNYYRAIAKSMDNVANDSARTYMYQAMDVLAQNGSALSGDSRSRSENSFMVFLQFGIMSVIMRNYGNPDPSTGAKGSTLFYDGGAIGASELSNKDACALAAAFGVLSDSYAKSDLSDTDSAAVVTTFNAVCTAASLSSCAVISKDRNSCDGANADSTTAAAMVTSVNTAWN